MYASVTTVVLNFVLGYVLISNFGYLAAGYSMLICYLLQATLDYLAMRKVVGQNVYNMKYIGVLSLAVILTAVFSNLLYDMIIVRYGIVVAVLNQVLIRSGREEQAMMTTLAGLVVVLMMLVQKISDLFDLIKTLFSL